MIIDVETTGLSAIRGDRIIEVAAVSLSHGEIVAEYYSLVHVPKKIPWQATRIHRITNDMLIGQPVPAEVYPVLKELMGDKLLVAHNARFDMAFLKHEMGLLGLSLPNRHNCTLDLARRTMPHLPNYRLATVAESLLGIVPGEVRLHRALDDARLTAQVWVALGMRAG